MGECEQSYEIDEYKALRDEQLQNLQDRMYMQVLILAITSTVISVGLSLKEPNPFLFLIPCPLILAVMYRVVGIVRHMGRISAYIRILIEPKLPGIRWESRLSWIGRQYGASPTRSRIALVSGALMDSTIRFSSIGLAFSLILASVEGLGARYLSVSITVVVPFYLHAAYSILNWQKYLDRFQDTWSKVRDQEVTAHEGTRST